jgi:predicted nuclease of predicted toxin-antitoxin system
MHLTELGVLCDENVASGVVEYLRARDMDVVTVRECGLSGEPDRHLLEYALHDNRVVLTHDGDFGQLAIAGGQPFIGIVFLRPGHILASQSVQMLAALLEARLDVIPSFIIVVRRSGDRIAIRARQLENEPKSPDES